MGIFSWFFGDDDGVSSNESILFEPQLFLMQNWKHFVSKSMDRQIGYNYLLPVNGPDPFEINNILHGSEDIMDYMNFNKKKLDLHLRPTIVFRKLYLNGTSVPFNLVTNEKWKNLDLGENPDPFQAAILAAGGKRPTMTMMKSFTWERKGSNPAQWRKNLSAKLSFSVTSPILLEARSYKNVVDKNNKIVENSKKYYSQLLDLIQKKDLTVEMSDAEYAAAAKVGPPIRKPNPEYYDIIASVQWTVFEVVGKSKLTDSEFKKLDLAASHMTTHIKLDLIKYNVDFTAATIATKKGGVLNSPIQIDVEYNGSIANTLLGSDMWSSENLSQDENQRNQRRSVNSRDITLEVKDWYEHYNKIIKHLVDNDRIYYSKIKKVNKTVTDPQTQEEKDIVVFSQGNTIQSGDDATEMKEALKEHEDDKDDLLESLREKRTSEDSDEFTLKWFYMGDLIDAALKQVYNDPDLKEAMENIRFIVGPIALSDSEGKQWSVNICDFPVSIETFTVWFQSKIMNEKKNFSVYSFLSDVFNSLIKSAIGPLNKLQPGVTMPQISFTSFSLPKIQDRDLIFGKFKPGKDAKIKARNINSFKKKKWPSAHTSDGGDPRIDYFMINISAGSVIMSDLNGNRTRDAKSGIPHVGNIETSGPVRSITFSKEDNPKLEAVLLRRAVKASKGTMVRSVHHAKLNMSLSTQFAPATLLYIDPVSIGLGNPNNSSSVANMLGIGGYFAVQGVSHSYNYAGTRSTELDCKWQNFGAGNTMPNDVIREFKPEIDTTAEITVEDD